MKVCLYVGDMNLNRKDIKKKYVEIENFYFFRKQNGDFFFQVQMCYSLVI